MTDIEFHPEGGFTVQEFWYLIPPYLKAIAGDPDLDGNINSGGSELLIQSPEHLEGVSDVTGECRVGGVNRVSEGTSGTGGTNPMTDISECDQYQIAMEDFHGKSVKTASGGGVFGNSYEELYMLTNTSDGINGNEDLWPNSFTYNGGKPNNYGPVDNDDTTIEYPNGYGSTNLSHYDPENFHLYFRDQNHYDDDPQNCNNYGTAGQCNANNCNWNTTPAPDVCENYWERESMRFGAYQTANPYNGTLVSETFYPLSRAVIHVKGGPARVHGTYKGAYTVVTSGFDAVSGNEDALYDGWSTYRRDAWNSIFQTGTSTNWTTESILPGGAPVDTIFTNIWITGDLVNADAACNGGTCGGPPQPQEEINNEPCAFNEPGACDSSENVMGLVSAANVIIANSPDNRDAINEFSVGVNVHASIVALNESFVMHYWQHNIDDFTNPFSFDHQWDSPPLSDGRGKNIYGTSNEDHRGKLRFWGGITQSYRGYMMRSQTGPYDGGSIGMDKDYWFDNNLYFPPPSFPYISRCPEDGVPTAPMSMLTYQTKTKKVEDLYELRD